MTYKPKAPAIVNQVFTSNGTYTPTANMVYCSVRVIGAGGGGGGADTVSIVQVAGGGGGSGAYAEGVFTASEIGASVSITIGTGGTGGANTGGNGGTGGTSSFGSLISCTGGVGGIGSGTDTTAGTLLGGAGGTASGSGVDFSSPGNPGFASVWMNGVPGIFVISGAGGASNLGTAGQSVVITTGGSFNGNFGQQGGGGSGALASGASVAGTGGAGGAGLIIVTEFIIP